MTLVNGRGSARRRHPNLIKKELRAARRSLKDATKKSDEKLAEFEAFKRAGALTSMLAEKERDFLAANRAVTHAESLIAELEDELLGDWAPRGQR